MYLIKNIGKSNQCRGGERLSCLSVWSYSDRQRITAHGMIYRWGYIIC